MNKTEHPTTKELTPEEKEFQALQDAIRKAGGFWWEDQLVENIAKAVKAAGFHR